MTCLIFASSFLDISFRAERSERPNVPKSPIWNAAVVRSAIAESIIFQRLPLPPPSFLHRKSPGRPERSQVYQKGDLGQSAWM